MSILGMGKMEFGFINLLLEQTKEEEKDRDDRRFHRAPLPEEEIRRMQELKMFGSQNFVI